MPESLRLEVDDASHVATLVLDRPPLNALSLEVWRELDAM
ncbi:MAG: hypothetical protein RLZZ272_969, partial [Actinomycetota bacterium]